MTDTPNRSDAFKIRPVDTCSWLDREPTDPTSYLDSIAAQGWAPPRPALARKRQLACRCRLDGRSVGQRLIQDMSEANPGALQPVADDRRAHRHVGSIDRYLLFGLVLVELDITGLILANAARRDAVPGGGRDRDRERFVGPGNPVRRRSTPHGRRR